VCVCVCVPRVLIPQRYLERCGRVQAMNGCDMREWCAEVSGDADLANARGQPWFQEMLTAAQSAFGALQAMQ